MTLPRLQAVAFVKRLESGRSRPGLFRCETPEGHSEGEYVVKLRASLESGTVAFAFEALGATLARKLGLTVPDSAQVEIDALLADAIHSAPIAYVHGELFGVNGVETIPDNPRGRRSKSIENRCKGRGEWNTYDVVAVDGVIKLSVNGKFVNGVSGSTQKKGYLCLESEGAEIHFRNIRIMELPPGVISADQVAAEL